MTSDAHALRSGTPPTPWVRAVLFAGTELLLDLSYLAKTFHQLDMDSVMILAAVNNETMRPWILAREQAHQHLGAVEVPETARGGVSRRLLAEKTGLPRETVRRRVLDLINLGLLCEVETGDVRVAQGLVVDAAYQASLEKTHEAVLRYLQRLRELGVDPETLQD